MNPKTLAILVYISSLNEKVLIILGSSLWNSQLG